MRLTPEESDLYIEPSAILIVVVPFPLKIKPGVALPPDGS